MERQDFQAAMQILDDRFLAYPDDPEAMFYFSSLMLESDHPGPARLICQYLIDRYPEKWQGWLNLARALDDLECHDESLDIAVKGLKVDASNEKLSSVACVAAARAHRWDECKRHAEDALAVGFDVQAAVNRGFAYLHEGRFGEGWDDYMLGIGAMTWREKREYGGRPQWDGSVDAKIVVYGEQGVGDQIAFLSAIPDAIAAGYQIVGISCYPKLTNLLRDTFEPMGIEVHGTQFESDPEWLRETDYTHLAPMSALQQHFRRTRESYTGAPYLKVNPAKSLQWRALLDAASDRPKVGIAWTGGARKSDAWRRKSMELDALKPILSIDGIDWICLQYKDASDEIARMRVEDGLIIREWPWGTQTEDYSDTAALVDNLDALVTVPTSVNHLAGAMGKPVHCLVHERAHFHYGAGMPYYSSVNLYDRTDESIAAIADEIAKLAPPRLILAGHGND